jgi:hypothetical protein
MSEFVGTDQWRFPVPAGARAAALARREARQRLLESGVSRRRFLGVSAGATGLIMAGGRWSPAFAAARSCEPRPIPHTLDPGGGITPIHVLLPGVAHPADADPSTITDFNGQVGYAIVVGTGTRTDRATNAVTQNPFQVDLRFMKGEFVGTDGRHCHGAFALI